MPKLPIDISDIVSAVKAAGKGSKKKHVLELMVHQDAGDALLAAVKYLFYPQTDAVSVKVVGFSDVAPVPSRNADAVFVVAGSGANCALMVDSLEQNGYESLLITDSLVELSDNMARRGLDLHLGRVVFFDVLNDDILSAFEADLSDWIIANLGRLRFSFAQAFPFLRKPFADELVKTCSIQNAAVAALGLIPGADLPLLCGNQIKLLVELSSLWGLKLDASRIAEVAACVLNGLLMRGLARAVCPKMKGASFLARGAIACCATYAIGHAASAYYQAGGSVAGLKSILERSAREGGENGLGQLRA